MAISNVYLLNAFSINLFEDDVDAAQVKFETLLQGEVEDILKNYENKVVNAIGHPTTDDVVRNDLGFVVGKGKRLSVRLTEDDVAIIAQYTGPRLEEGTTELPEGAKIKYWLVLIKY